MKETKEVIVEELNQLLIKKGYVVSGINIESADVLNVEIEVNSKTEKIYAYVYEDRFVLTAGFSSFDVLNRNGASEQQIKEEARDSMKLYNCTTKKEKTLKEIELTGLTTSELIALSDGIKCDFNNGALSDETIVIDALGQIVEELAKRIATQKEV